MMSSRVARAAFLSAMILIGARGSATAQSWVLDAYAGQANYDGIAAEVAAANAVLGVRYTGADGWFFLSAGSPLAAGSPLWGATGVGRRLFAKRAWISAGADLSAYGHGYRDSQSSSVGFGGSVEALPFIAFARGHSTLELRSGMLQYAATYSGQTRSRRLHDSGARLTLQAAPPLVLAAEARYARAEEGDYPYAGGSAVLDLGPGQIWGSAGRWLASSLSEVSWSTGINLGLGVRTELWGALRQQSSDPLYWNGSRRSWNLGISHRFGGDLPRAVPVPVQASVGGVTIRLPRSEVDSRPSIAGDFSDWKPLPMTLSGDVWTVLLPLEPGLYQYAFRSATGDWFVPESTPGRRDDGFGGYVAVLIVPER